MSPGPGCPINHSKQVVRIARAASIGDGEGKNPAYVRGEKNYRSKTEKTDASLSHCWKREWIGPGHYNLRCFKRVPPPNEGKPPEMGQLLIEYNINYSMHY